MRKLLGAAVAALALALPATPAAAGPAACTVTAGFPVCAGTCSGSDPITVIVIGNGSGTASCGGGTAQCFAFRGACTDSGTAGGSGALSCSGSAPVVICLVGITAN